ncbi:MAG: hypothetical protein HZY76_06455 [Anaerolineae bacterium]|nr:MAG: hypothetical protein HZY76_06455 [Anaerolineae bacterium]
MERTGPDGQPRGLVVQFGDGSVQTYCIQFTAPSITGYDLLQATDNLQVIYDATSTGFGAGVCKINNDGCNFPLDDCFCQCQGSTASIGPTFTCWATTRGRIHRSVRRATPYTTAAWMAGVGELAL